MKKLLIFCSVFTLILGCAAPKHDGFIIKGEIKGAGDGDIVFVSVTIDNNMITDTLNMVDGKFEYKGKVEYPMLYKAILHSNKLSEDGYYIFALFVENSNISISGDISSSKSVVVKGSASNDEYKAINEAIAEANKRYRNARQVSSEAFKANDAEKQDKANADIRESLTAIKDKLIAMPNYSTSLVIPKVINDYFSASSSPNFMDEITLGFDKSIHNHPIVKYLIEDNIREKSVQPGNSAFNFELQDVNGETYRLSDMKGKYVLLEFSASWCGWCKLEVPFLKEVYELTKGREDFVMFTVNLDVKRELWEQEAKEVPWATIGDLQGTKGGVAREYNIHGVPILYLISPEGKIISRDLRRENLVKYFKDEFPKK